MIRMSIRDSKGRFKSKDQKYVSFLYGFATILGIYYFVIVPRPEVVTHRIYASGAVGGVEDVKEVEVVSEDTVELEQGKDTVQAGAVGQSASPVAVSVEVKECEYCYISDWSVSKIQGSRVDRDYVEALYRASGEDLYITELAVAISFAETGLGTNTNTRTNFAGYDIHNRYDPVDVMVFAERFTRGLSNGYRNVENNPLVLRHGNQVYLADYYTGGDRTQSWLRAVNEALREMKK